MVENENTQENKTDSGTESKTEAPAAQVSSPAERYAALTVYERLHKAKEEVGYIEKEKYKTPQGFRPLSRNKIVGASRAVLLKWGVDVKLDLIDIKINEYKVKNFEGLRCLAVFNFILTSINNPGDKIQFRIGGSGVDQLDKFFSKARADAEKNGYIVALQLEYGESEGSEFFGAEEDSPNGPSAPTITATQVIELRHLAKLCNVAEEIISRTAGVEKLEAIPAVNFEILRDRLTKRANTLSNTRQQELSPTNGEG